MVSRFMRGSHRDLQDKTEKPLDNLLDHRVELEHQPATSEKETDLTTETVADAQAAPATVSENANIPISIMGPQGLKDALEAAATLAGVSRVVFIRRALADATGFTLPPETARTRKRKYATAEEREAAQKARALDRRDLINKLLEANRQAAAAGTPIAV